MSGERRMGAKAKQPNFVLINCDDLGYGDLACYGSPYNRTPALDRMAAEGVRLTDFYMASPVCSPSRGAMMTGCYPPRISFDVFEPVTRPGVPKAVNSWVLFPGSPGGLHPDEITVARLLKDQGYATCHIGKWHCGDQPEFLPTRHGFDYYFGLPYSNDMGIQPPHPDRPPLPLMENEEPIELQPDQRSLTIRYVEHSVRFIRQNRERPFFLYLAHMHVHLPHYPPEIFLRRSANGPYGGAVECIDWSVSVILHELRRLGLDENTLVVFTSDNGSRGDRGGSNRPLRGIKGTTWEGGQRVPCIAWWPGRIPAGTESGEVVTAMDFLPTFANLAGTKAPDDRTIDGKDILGVLTGREKSPHEAFFYYQANRLNAVRSGPWKLHVGVDGRPTCELYNLENDIGEKQNVADQHPDVVARLQKLIAACREDMGDAMTGVKGKNRRPAGHVDNAKPLAEQDPTHPYIIAMYDLPDVG
ncbi:MAG: sulfatase [Sedimentisphaerales bacterium]|nr:sulfatase [Sedimentisphaerales bacterium]